MRHARVHRMVTGTQRIRVTHSRLGFPQIRASSTVQHQQVHQQTSSSTTAETGFPAPAGGSRGPQILSEIPLSPKSSPCQGSSGPCADYSLLSPLLCWTEHRGCPLASGQRVYVTQTAVPSYLRAMVPVRSLASEM